MVSISRIKVLSWADLFATYAMWVMVTYLTDVWQLSPTHAAGIVNIWNGLAKMLPLIFARFLGGLRNFHVLLVSSIAYTIGLGFLTISTPRVTGSCSECIGDTQKGLFYVALTLIAVGIAGHFVSLQPFMHDQIEDESNDDNRRVIKFQPPRNEEQGGSPSDINTERVENTLDKKTLNMIKVLCQKIVFYYVVVICTVAGVVLQYIKPWSLRFGIPTIFTLVATLLFTTVTCSRSYKFSSRSIKATIVGLPMIPVLLTFLICGLVYSVGNTYFLEQANTMSLKLGSIKVPLTILLLFYNYVKLMFEKIYMSFAYPTSETYRAGVSLEEGEEGPVENEKRIRKYAPSIGIGMGMVFSILCCITAARIETQRLNVIRDHGLLDKPDETVPMTVFKLFPQFLLLAAFDGMFGKSSVDFLRGQGYQTLSKIFARGVSGLGIMSSVLFAYVVGKVSEKGGRTNWFQESLSKSRLDRYYWTLAALSAVNLVFYMVVACCCYSYSKEEAGDEEEAGGEKSTKPDEDNEESTKPNEDNAQS